MQWLGRWARGNTLTPASRVVCGGTSERSYQTNAKADIGDGAAGRCHLCDPEVRIFALGHDVLAGRTVSHEFPPNHAAALVNCCLQVHEICEECLTIQNTGHCILSQAEWRKEVSDDCSICPFMCTALSSPDEW